MAITWYYIHGNLALGVDWNATVSNTSVKLAPKIYRWDYYSTDNYGGSFDEHLTPDPSGAGAWYDLDFGSGNGERLIDTFTTRTYTRGKSAQTVSLKIAWSDIGSYYDGKFNSLGSGSHTWTYTVEAKPSYTVKYNANGGSHAPSAQTKWYGEALTLSTVIPGRVGYVFLGWATSANATSAKYAAGGSYTANASATLYAVWKQEVPSAPEDCTNKRNSDAKNTVSWATSSTPAGPWDSVKIERSVDGGAWSQIASVAGTAASYADTTTSANHRYRYRVRACNATGCSGYATSGYTYNTPAAPTSITASRSGETTVALTIENPAKTATALELQRSTDGETWQTVQTITGTAVTSAVDEPGGGTFWYRARNTRGSLVSAWSAASNAVVTLCAPAAPTLIEPASSITMASATTAYTFTWAHNPVDGSAQTAAELGYSTDAGATWTIVQMEGDDQSMTVEVTFAPNITVTWRVRTKGVHEDFGPWSGTRSFFVRQAPTVSFAQPPDSFVVENMPIRVELDYEDISGTLAHARLSILLDGAEVWSIDLGTTTAFDIRNADFLPDNGEEYLLVAEVRSTSTLGASAVREMPVSFVPPMRGKLVLENDPETGYVSVLIEIEYDEELVEAEHLSVYRISNGKRKLLGEGLPPGTAIVDKYAPLNMTYSYEVVSFAASGAYSIATFDNELITPWIFAYWGEEGLARIRWDPEASIEVTRPSRKRIWYAGRRYPVSYDSSHLSDNRTVSGLLMEKKEADAFMRLVEDGGLCVYKSGDGDVMHADADVTLRPELTIQSYYGRASLTLVRIDGGDL